MKKVNLRTMVKIIRYMTRKNMPFLPLVEGVGVDLGQAFLGRQGDLGLLGVHLETEVNMSKASIEKEGHIKEGFLRIEGTTQIGDLSPEVISLEEKGSMTDPTLGDPFLQEVVMRKKHH